MFSLSKNSIPIRNNAGFLRSIATIISFLCLSLIIFFPKNSLSLTTGSGGYDEFNFLPNLTYINFSPVEFINPYSGNVTLIHQDISLPGNGGFDLNLNRIYNSKQLFILGQWAGPVSSGAFGLGWQLEIGRLNPRPSSPILSTAFVTMPDGAIFQVLENNNTNINTSTSAT